MPENVIDKGPISWTEDVETCLAGIDPEELIDTCEEWTRWRFRALVLTLALAGFGRIRVIDGRRTLGGQYELYGAGRTEEELERMGVPRHYACPEKVQVTWCLPKYSNHVRGRAIDVQVAMYENVRLPIVGDVARCLGVTWGGNWGYRDAAHFEL